MKISPAIVRVKKITPPSSKILETSETDLNEAANLILEMGGVINPIILRRTTPEAESYSIISGQFEYFAAVRAMEINPKMASTINAYIAESEEEESLYNKQVKVFRQRTISKIEKSEQITTPNIMDTYPKEHKLSEETDTNTTKPTRAKLMRKISHGIVMVEDIVAPNTTRKNYSPQEIEDLANSILSIGGLIQPLLLKEVGIDQYELIGGEMEYRAALRASEIDPLEGETINAFISHSDEEVQLYKEQLLITQL